MRLWFLCLLNLKLKLKYGATLYWTNFWVWKYHCPQGRIQALTIFAKNTILDVLSEYVSGPRAFDTHVLHTNVFLFFSLTSISLKLHPFRHLTRDVNNKKWRLVSTVISQIEEESAISFIIFRDTSMFYQIFLSPQVKRLYLQLVSRVAEQRKTSDLRKYQESV